MWEKVLHATKHNAFLKIDLTPHKWVPMIKVNNTFHMKIILFQMKNDSNWINCVKMHAPYEKWCFTWKKEMPHAKKPLPPTKTNCFYRTKKTNARIKIYTFTFMILHETKNSIWQSNVKGARNLCSLFWLF